jgi:D-alanyl-D-alanine carboxypeptidase (penicillin-binding protein 5/6)
MLLSIRLGLATRFSLALFAASVVVLIAPIHSAHAAMPVPKAPDVPVRSYILIDYQSRKVLAENNPDVREEPASLTKLMTAYGVFMALKEKRLKLTDDVTISEHAWRAEGSRTFVKVGSQVPAEILIKGMIIQSGNDATIALAERIGGTEDAFVQLMNEYAKRLGMKATHFANSDGLPNPEHYSTARDLATLAMALIRDFPEYYKYYSMKEFTWNNIKQQNRNGLLSRDPTVDGLKTGHTESAGFCLVTSANRDGMRLVSVVLGAPTIKGREDASAALLNYGYTFYETLKVKRGGETVLKPRVWMSDEEFAAVGPLQDIVLTVPRGEAASLKTTAKVNEPLMAPLPAGKPVGELTVATASGDIAARVPLYPLKPVTEGGLWTRMVDKVKLWFE